MNSNSARSQNRPTPKRQTEHLTLWVKPIIKAELQRRAERGGVSVSKTGATFLERAMQAEVDMQYGALLQPVIETTLRKYFSRFVFFLARIAFDIGVIKGLMIWLCRRLAGASKEQVDSVIHQSRERARKSMTSLTPEFATFLEELKKTLQEEEGG